jgi:hypothetical protein
MTGAQIDGLAITRAVIVAPVNIVGTSSAAPTTAITVAGGFFEGGTYNVEVYAPFLTVGTTNLDIELWIDGVFSQSLSGHMAASIPRPGVSFNAYVALGNGSHSFLIRGFVDAGTGVFGAGAGTTGVAPNAYCAVFPA